MTTTALTRRLSMPSGPGPTLRAAALGFLVAFGSGLVLLAGASLAVGATSGDAILPRVTVGGVDVGGLSRAAAERRLRAELPSLTSGRAVVAVGGQEVVVPYAEIGRGYELDAMIDAAHGAGRGGGTVTDGIERLRALMAGIAVPVEVHAVDSAALDRFAAQIAGRFSRDPVDAAVVASGTSFSVAPSSTGRLLPADEVRAELAAAVASSDPRDARIVLEPSVVAPAVTTADARAAAAAARGMVADLELTLAGAGEDDRPGTITASAIASWITFGPDYGVAYAAHLDEAALAAVIASVAERIDRPATNAAFSLAGGGIGGVVPGAEGREVDVEATTAGVLDVLARRAGGAGIPSFALVVDVTEPELTTEEAEAAFPKMALVSSWTTYYTPNDGNGYGANINIGARDIDGRVLLPGEEFSFWDSIGPVTLERGYHYGGVIIGGRSVAGGAIGGGICSTSTTIFNAALRAGLEMGDRRNHSYYIPRYPDGLDATVYMDESYVQDMTFTNDTDSPIVIRGFGGNGFVRFDLWMVPSGRRVVLTDPLVSNFRAAVETTQVDASLAPGTSRRVEYPKDGHDVTRSRYVYDASGTLIHENHYFSAYRVVNGITVVGPKPAATPAPPAATPAPTPDPSSAPPSSPAP